MRTQGHTAAWGSYMGRARHAKGWSNYLKAWWAAGKTLRREARLAAKPLRAEAASDMVAPTHARSVAMALCHLSV